MFECAEKILSLRTMLLGLIIVASATPVLAFNDPPGAGAPDGGPVGATAPSTTVQPGMVSPGTVNCRSKPQLTAEERARRKALKAERTAQLGTQGVAPSPKRHSAKPIAHAQGC